MLPDYVGRGIRDAHVLVIVGVLVIVLGACGDSTMARPDADDDGGDGDACPSGLVECEEADGVTRCVDLQRDDCHCGYCGNVCYCSAGLCSCPEGRPGFIDCRPALCTRGAEVQCVDSFRDPLNCGGCGIECAPGEGCVNTLCVPLP